MEGIETRSILAILFSGLAVFACLLVIPITYNQLSSLEATVVLDMEEFRASIEDSWAELMLVRAGPKATSDLRETAESIFGGREKRRAGRAERDSCQCDSANRCPAGPKGAPGANGVDGAPGENGRQGAPGKRGDEVAQLAAYACPQCPNGAPGPQGVAGPAGPPGPSGPPGANANGGQGRPGAPGPQGDAGQPGRDGKPGSKGPNGRDATIGTRGPAGPKGAPGRAGAPGAPGNRGADATASSSTGPAGPQGPAGPRGSDGIPGSPGRAGSAGTPGPDAFYCPCPKRYGRDENAGHAGNAAPLAIPAPFGVPPVSPAPAAPQSQTKAPIQLAPQQSQTTASPSRNQTQPLKLKSH